VNNQLFDHISKNRSGDTTMDLPPACMSLERFVLGSFPQLHHVSNETTATPQLPTHCSLMEVLWKAT
jgi:hypothetical protein